MFFHALSFTQMKTLYLPFLATTLFRPEFLHRPNLLFPKVRVNVLFALIKRNTLQILLIFLASSTREVLWRKKNVTLLNRLVFCLRIVLKYRIEVS